MRTAGGTCPVGFGAFAQSPGGGGGATQGSFGGFGGGHTSTSMSPVAAAVADSGGRGLHSSTSQFNLSHLCPREHPADQVIEAEVLRSSKKVDQLVSAEVLNVSKRVDECKPLASGGCPFGFGRGAGALPLALQAAQRNGGCRA